MSYFNCFEYESGFNLVKNSVKESKFNLFIIMMVIFSVEVLLIFVCFLLGGGLLFVFVGFSFLFLEMIFELFLGMC